jgi:Tfp pilus assembly protein FimV
MAIYAPRTAKARLRRTITVAVLLGAAAILGPQAFANDAPTDPAELDTYTVAAGETLWSIASDLTPADGDVRETMVAIQRLNAMSGSQLAAGTQLVIPPLER